MKLAEALIQRADLQKRVEALRHRIMMNATYQEGEEPSEIAAELLQDCLRSVDDLEKLVTAINLSNATATGADGRTMTALLAARESLRTRHSVLVQAADAAGLSLRNRQLRSELRQVSALPVADLRAQADTVAAQLRDLDVVIQSGNWEVDLRG